MIVSDLKQQTELFVDLIGLEVQVEYPGYVRIGGAEGFHIGMEEGDPGPANRLEITIRVDDVDHVYTRLQDGGVAVEGPPTDQPWGARHAWFADADGRRMSVFSPTNQS